MTSEQCAIVHGHTYAHRLASEHVCGVMSCKTVCSFLICYVSALGVLVIGVFVIVAGQVFVHMSRM